ncbi:UNVERIFIED_CONTAM: hypothetical protein Slati_1877800 [Sesamum latifolium]|uniref:Uncharacterized protein n=1 Tax=Sesamum latifolium TaxID=2727402 RepID=A0AAW2WZW9_9LAMI
MDCRVSLIVKPWRSLYEVLLAKARAAGIGFSFESISTQLAPCRSSSIAPNEVLPVIEPIAPALIPTPTPSLSPDNPSDARLDVILESQPCARARNRSHGKRVLRDESDEVVEVQPLIRRRRMISLVIESFRAPQPDTMMGDPSNPKVFPTNRRDPNFTGTIHGDVSVGPTDPTNAPQCPFEGATPSTSGTAFIGIETMAGMQSNLPGEALSDLHRARLEIWVPITFNRCIFILPLIIRLSF